MRPRFISLKPSDKATKNRARFGLSLRRESPVDEDGEQLVPLINLVFLLMVFFLLVGSISKRDVVQIKPPESSNEQIRPALTPQLLVSLDGGLQFDGKPVRYADLPGLNLNRVEILADASMDMGSVKRVLVRLQGAGIEEISLLTRRP